MSESSFTPTALLFAKQQAHALYLQLEQCLDANPGGLSNPDALRQMKTLVLHLKRTSSLFSEKADNFLVWAEILYSPRKHGRWDHSLISGTDQVRGFMYHDLVSLKTIIGRMSDCP